MRPQPTSQSLDRLRFPLQLLGKLGELLDLAPVHRLEQGLARRINSGLTLALSCDGADVLTIEGVAHGDALHPVQAAFIAHDGFQCGFCTPGQIMSAIGLIQEGQTGDDPERVREAMSGNLCRCGAYAGILEAVLDAQDRLREANQRRSA
ncbi:MAG: hypothetical protein JOZ94_20555 [Xanthobacteraceae bacterium]|nr:hypothetical protein [Xanthobacteraceae bacterium]